MNNFILIVLILPLKNINCITHWKLNKDNGLIEPIQNSLYTLQRPYDLVSFIKQDERVIRLNHIKNILSTKELSKKQDDSTKDIAVSTYQETFYNSDSDCLKAGQPLVKFSFYESNYNTFKDELIRHLRGPNANVFKTNNKKENDNLRIPNCNAKLPFSLLTYDHLDVRISFLFNVSIEFMNLSMSILNDTHILLVFFSIRTNLMP